MTRIRNVMHTECLPWPAGVQTLCVKDGYTLGFIIWWVGTTGHFYLLFVVPTVKSGVSGDSTNHA